MAGGINGPRFDGFQKDLKQIQDVHGKATSAYAKQRHDATHWGVLGVSIPKGVFKDKEALKAIETAQNEIWPKLMEILANQKRDIAN